MPEIENLILGGGTVAGFAFQAMVEAGLEPGRLVILSADEAPRYHFLNHPGMEAANWPSEHVIRPAMVYRNSGGGNRSYPGAEIHAVLMSLLRTAHQEDLHRHPPSSDSGAGTAAARLFGVGVKQIRYMIP